MKKFNTNKLVALLAALCLMTSAFVGSTLAKYVTSDENAKDTARVAKFGVTVAGDDTTDFLSTYETHDDEFKTSITHSVTSADSATVVAPGTSGNLTDMVITGKPEVAVDVTFTADLVLKDWTVDSAEYCPLIITVENEKYYIGKTAEINSVATLEKAVEDAIVACRKQYGPNTDFADKKADLPTVSWEWEFEKTTVASQDDVKDTALGDAATAATISLDITTTVTQID